MEIKYFYLNNVNENSNIQYDLKKNRTDFRSNKNH